MRCLIAVDGLSLEDLPFLLSYLAKSKQFLKHHAAVSLESSNSSPQASWGEILSGKNCFTNGCVGYAYPRSSLNRLEVFSESDLLMPLVIAESNQKGTNAAINIPLLRPNDSNRIWLADGSLSIAKVVSPQGLQAEPIFASYEPRPYKTHAGAALLPQRNLLERCLEIESQRLSCAVALFKRQPYVDFLYRLTIFDQLSHLVGLNFLSATDLSLSAQLHKFLAEFDEALAMFCTEPDTQMSLVSSYSHVPCVDTVNLNLVLASGGFARFIEDDQSSDARAPRLKIVQALWQPTSHYLSTLEGRLDPAQTTAASPVSGAIYINRSTVFDDGIVNDLDYSRVRSNVHNFLQNYLLHRFPGRFSLEVHPAEINGTIAPDLIVKIDGVEFENLTQDAVPVRPLTTHSTDGFLLTRASVDGNKIKTSELASLLSA